MKEKVVEVPKYKPSLTVSSTRLGEIDDLQINEKVIVYARGKINSISADMYDNKKTYRCSIELSDVDIKPSKDKELEKEEKVVVHKQSYK